MRPVAAKQRRGDRARFATNTNVSNLQNQINSGTIGLVQQSAAGQPITVASATDGTLVNFTGTGGTRTLTGISAGTLSAASTDAVTGAQVFTANQRVAAAFGTTLDGANQINAPSYTIQGTSYGNIASAFTAVDTALNAGAGTATYVKVNSTGPAASATGTDAIAFGSGALASQTNAMAIGTNAQATGTNAIAIGNGAVATGSVAVGNGALASNGGAAFGDNAVATGTNSTAVGPGATATHANAAAFGNGATTTRANQHVYGTASNTYTMPGITSAASRAAQSGPTQVVTSDAAGNLATTTLSASSADRTRSITAPRPRRLGPGRQGAHRRRHGVRDGRRADSAAAREDGGDHQRRYLPGLLRARNQRGVAGRGEHAVHRRHRLRAGREDRRRPRRIAGRLVTMDRKLLDRKRPMTRLARLCTVLLLASTAAGVSSAARWQSDPASPSVDSWRLAQAAQPATQPATPVSLEQALYLIRSTLLTLNDANRSGNYTVLRDLASPDFQANNTAADLSQIFADLRKRNIDLHVVAITAPQLSTPPYIDNNKMLRLTGFFPTKPLQINPGSLLVKIATSGTPSAAARCVSPVSTPTTNAAPAISRATSSSGRRSGTRVRANAQRDVHAHASCSGSLPHGSTISNSGSSAATRSRQWSRCHCLPGFAVACRNTP